MENPFTDEYFMKKALQEAEIAFEKGEVPVGALIVVDNKIGATLFRIRWYDGDKPAKLGQRQLFVERKLRN